MPSSSSADPRTLLRAGPVAAPLPFLFRVPVIVVVVVVVVAVGGGCAHTVRIESNVPEAQVRVDGVPRGTVGEGAAFTEHWGIGTRYDVEVSAPGYRVERRWVHPDVVDPVAGVSAIAAAGGGCVGGGCAFPWLALQADTAPATLGFVGLSLVSLAVGAGGCAVLVGGAERMPDTLRFDLVREGGAAGDDDVPPPPVDGVDDAAPGPSTGGPATSGDVTASVAW